ncbi:MAG TPA: hypothetical protein P5293_05750 [Bacteroidales bacterium]|nr:hypothetical protein [Bacteroidales bacterium]
MKSKNSWRNFQNYCDMKIDRKRELRNRMSCLEKEELLIVLDKKLPLYYNDFRSLSKKELIDLLCEV